MIEIDKVFKLSDKNLKDLITLLTATSKFYDKEEENHLLKYGGVCNCDDQFLCEHRKDYIIEWILSRSE